MRRALLLIFSAATAAQAEDPLQAERKKLLGPWVTVSFEMEGKILTPADLKMRGLCELKITFREDVVTHQSLGLLRSFRYRIDPAKTPKEIDMELTPAGDLDISFRGIYKLDGDTLTLCEVADGSGRAKEFKTLTGRPSRLIVLKRHKAGHALSDAALARLNQADTVFTAKITRKAAAGLPPHGLAFADVLWLVAIGPYGHIDLMTPAGDRVLAQAGDALALPLGWTLEGGRPVSPWAPLAIRWTGPAPDKTPVCAKTGRPALPAGDPIDIAVSHIIPRRVDPFRNPYGDGRFKVTVTNRGDRPVIVPALLADGKNILWADSLVVIDISTASNHGATCLLQGAGAIAKAKDLRPVELQPGESVSAEVDVRHARGVAFHPGGARYYFRFCLGEKSATSFFYFRS
jgi:uncharacterized protein (TIGR03067 family)